MFLLPIFTLSFVLLVLVFCMLLNPFMPFSLGVMDYSSDEESDLSDSEINEYKEKPYEELRTGKYKVKNVNGTLRCPFCAGKKKQEFKYKDLLQHASGVSKGSANRRAKQKANHLALATYLENDLANEAEQLPPKVIEVAPVSEKSEQNDLYCWPWTGIVTNIIDEPGNGKELGSREYWLKKFSKYKPLEVEIFCDDQNQTVQAVVRFDNDWAGFNNAMLFEKSFETNHHSKKEWTAQKEVPGSNIYGWFARADDYNSEGLVGEYLRKKGELKTISNLIQEAALDRNKIVANLATEIDLKNQNLDELQYKYNEKTMSLSRMLEEKDMLHQAFYEGSLPFCCLCVFQSCIHVFVDMHVNSLIFSVYPCMNDVHIMLVDFVLPNEGFLGINIRGTFLLSAFSPLGKMEDAFEHNLKQRRRNSIERDRNDSA